MLPTASSLERASRCLGSAVLPRVDELSPAGDRGSAIHAFLARVVEVGRDAALDELTEEHRTVCSVIDLDALPTSSLEVIPELALAYDTESGVARELGRNIGRDYPPAASREFVGTADIVTVGAGEVMVADFKTGHGVVTRAHDNPQLRFLGLAAARLFKRSHLRVAVVRLAEDGSAFFDSADFDAVELDIVAEELHRLAVRIEAARDLLTLGEPPPTTVGVHCRQCRNLTYCPAHTVLVSRLASQPAELADEFLQKLTPTTAAACWTNLKVADEVLRRVRESIQTYAREHPIDLGNGFVIGEVETRRRSLDGRVAFDVLRRLYGVEVAEIAVELDASQASIDRALRPVAESSGGRLSALKRTVMRELEAAGAVSIKTSRTVREHRAADGEQENAT